MASFLQSRLPEPYFPRLDFLICDVGLIGKRSLSPGARGLLCDTWLHALGLTSKYARGDHESESQ